MFLCNDNSIATETEDVNMGVLLDFRAGYARRLEVAVNTLLLMGWVTLFCITAYLVF